MNSDLIRFVDSISRDKAIDKASVFVDLETARDVLGHADVSTTALYLHSSDQRKKEAAAKLVI